MLSRLRQVSANIFLFPFGLHCGSTNCDIIYFPKTPVFPLNRKTNTFNTPVGNFSYRSIREDLFFGYDLVRMGNHTVKIANPEKTFLDFIYLNEINEIHEMEGLRINTFVANRLINIDRLYQYLAMYHSGMMEKRIQNFIEYIHAES